MRMRIFTPTRELPFAGHPTLGTAFVLAGPLQLVEIKLETGRGTVPVQLEREGARISFGWMAQPQPTIEPFPHVDELQDALGARSELPVEVYDNGVAHVFVALPSREAVVALEPDIARLERFGAFGFNCFAGDGSSWKSRMFGPGLGMAEDPATGSAAGPLALHLLRHERIAPGTEIEIEQGVEIRRPSKLHARIDGDGRIEVESGAGGDRRARRVLDLMRIAITGPSGSGKTTLALELARVTGLRHVEIDALHHGPNWESCGVEVLHERVAAATAGDDWVTDSTYHTMLGDLVVDRADVLVWLDLPIPLVMWRLVRRSYVRHHHRVELWNGNLEPGLRDQVRYLIWPAFQRAFENRRDFPRRYRQRDLRRLRSDADVRAFVQSIQAAATTSGSSNGSERQKRPPFLDT